MGAQGPVLRRPRVTELLGRGKDYPITLLQAPPGYGKTVALREFASLLGDRASWLSLTPGHRDPAGLVDSLEAMAHGLRSSDGSAFADAPGFLLVDGYEQVAEDAAAGGALLDWVAGQRRGLHVYLASRARPNLPLGRLRADRLVYEVGAGDLALTTTELRDFLRQVGGLDVPSDALGDVSRQSEGWVAGLVLSLAVLRGAEAETDLQEALSGQAWAFQDYFREEVLSSLSTRTRELLSQLAVLEEMTPAASEAVTGRSDAMAVLAELHSRGMFVSAKGLSRHRFRYQRMFRDFLYGELQAGRDPAVLRCLHGQAGDALLRSGEHSHAVGQYLQARLPDQAADVLSKVGFGVLQHGGLADLERWLGSLPGSDVAERPWLAALQGRLRRLRLDFDGALVSLSLAQTRFRQVGDVDGSAWATSEIHQVGYVDRSYADSIRATEKALEDSALSSVAKAHLAAHLCWMRCETGPVQAAVLAGERGLAFAGHIDDPTTRQALYRRITRNLGLARLLEGRLERSLVLLDSPGESGGPDDFEYSWSCIIQAIAVFLAGDDARAWQLLETAAARTSRHSSAQRQWSSLWRGNILRSRGDLVGASAYYDRAGGAGIVDRAVAEILLGGRRRPQLTAAEDADQLLGSDSLVTRAGAHLVRGLACATRSPEESLQALHEAESLFSDGGYRHHAVSVAAHRAALHRRMRQVEEAEDVQIQVDTWLLTSGFRRLYWQPPSTEPDGSVGPAPGQPREQGSPPQSAQGAHRSRLPSGEHPLVTACPDPRVRARVREAQQRGLTDRSLLELKDRRGLTWREVDVFLAYFLRIHDDLAAGTTFRDRCAKTLGISEHTLKTHITRIRGKLELPEGATPDELGRWVLQQETMTTAGVPRGRANEGNPPDESA